ncbi:DUF4350 domain-containing protein [Gloeocapsa sp. PCC 73106]|uniref:DUF4350 domain-containing protein n=1 Tax=Gloeocapsa sp. PCC 73106 TaxID=102232 RepID=UPI0002ACD0A7|nr:DUF4350 domain-containing protein [Gloeocapsa sp. PCC 73106]ELR98730.1 hypothetical protein GLO73106DRAFT_00025680 [Gloeocapsa sp. PCC 73106]
MSQKQIRLSIAIAIGVLLILTIALAPRQSNSQSGSSYHRGPNGYGAWYSWMQEQQIEIERLLKPIEDLTPSSPVTVIQVYGKPTELVPVDWASQGNTLVVLGLAQSAIAPTFSTLIPTPQGEVRIDTRRRGNDPHEIILLGDASGAIVWERKVDSGKIIYATTPYLAANAYQDYLANYQFLAQLVTQSNQPIWFDEYIHGYKDSEIIAVEAKNNLYSYFASTPLLPLLVQLFLLFLLALWSGFRPLGLPLSLSKIKQDNSLSYIQALGAVLAKANKSEYIIDIIGKNQQKQLQKALGLEEIPLDDTSLTNVWVKYTDKNAQALTQWLKTRSNKKPLSQTELSAWLIQGQKIRDDLNHEAK